MEIINIPRHVAIIMDGNGRWAKSKGLSRNIGHRYGSERIEDILQASIDLKIEYLSLYTFSLENNKRSEEEKSFLFSLIDEYFTKRIDELVKKGVNVKFIGFISDLPLNIQQTFKTTEELTKDGNVIHLNVMFNYGSIQELNQASKDLALDYKNGNKDISEYNLSDYLQTVDSPMVDLLIRTGLDYRISNFMLYQSSYAELFFIKEYWPDFTKKVYLKVLKDYQKRERRFGGINEN
jgi:undecaprenyl diphosphate synthase